MNILVTRPSPFGEELVAQLIQIGNNAWHFPLIKICPKDNLFPLITKLNILTPDDFLFIVSQHAIYFANSWLKNAGISWPKKLKCYAIGKTSGLKTYQLTGYMVNFPKYESTSEALLRLFTLTQSEISGKRVLILRGNNGRKIIDKALIKKGAEVFCCECYYREFIYYNGEREGERLLNLKIDAVVVSSKEILIKLYSMLPEYYRKIWLLNCKIIVVSKRLASCAQKLGWRTIIISKNASNFSILSVFLKN